MKLKYSIMKEGKGKFVNRKTSSSTKKYDSFFVYIPTELARDSLFPFTDGEAVKVSILYDKKAVLLEKVDEEKTDDKQDDKK